MLGWCLTLTLKKIFALEKLSQNDPKATFPLELISVLRHHTFGILRPPLPLSSRVIKKFSISDPPPPVIIRHHNQAITQI